MVVWCGGTFTALGGGDVETERVEVGVVAAAACCE